MEAIRELIRKVAPTAEPVLILGERGVGKSFLARTIHRLSERAGDFVVLSCRGLSDEQIETELLGWERNALTGKSEAQGGRIEAASGGTLFLEEAGEIPRHLQGKLVTMLTHGSVLRVGSTRRRPVDVRLICASSQDLDAAHWAGTLRSDQYWCSFLKNGVRVPPLRARTEEIPRLTDFFIRDFCRETNRAPLPRVSPEAVELLRGYPWPGNVGELKQVIRRALGLCHGPEIAPIHLTIEMRAFPREVSSFADLAEKAELRRVSEALKRVDSRMIDAALRRRSARGLLQASARKCSLCGDLEEDVKKLVSGPRVFICDQCVEESQRIIHEAAESPGSALRLRENAAGRHPDVSCAFCGKSSNQVCHLVGGEKALICDECLDLCDDIIGEQFSVKRPLGIGDAMAFHSDYPSGTSRKTFTFRGVYPIAAFYARIAQASDELGRDRPCRIVIFVGDTGYQAAQFLLDRVKDALSGCARFQDYDPVDRAAVLTTIAIPRSAADLFS